MSSPPGARAAEGPGGPAGPDGMGLAAGPPGRRGRAARVALVLLLDAALAGTGALLIVRSLRAPSLSVVVSPAPPVPAEHAPPPATTAAAIASAPTVPPATHRAPEPARPLPAGHPPEILARGGALPGKPADPGVMKGPRVIATVPQAIPAPAAEPDAPPAPAAGPPAATGDPPAPSPGPPELPPAPPVAPVVAAPPDAPPEPPVDHAWVQAMTSGIRQVVDDHRDAILDCYRRAAKASTPADPLRGRLEVHLRVLPSGDAEDVRVVQNQTGSEELGACLVVLMRTLRYPAPGAEAMDFVWPFTFQGQN